MIIISINFISYYYFLWLLACYKKEQISSLEKKKRKKDNFRIFCVGIKRDKE